MTTKRKLTPYEQNHLRKWAPKIDSDAIGDQPVEYTTGHVEFLGLDFLVTPDTLIPRLESEQMVTDALQFIDDHDLAHPTIADIGTGSGCLGISLAVKLAKRQIPYSIFLSDISLKALKVADLNAQRLLHSPENLFFLESNLLENFPKIQFDLILANLPYIPSKNIAGLDPSVKDFEPKIALDGGPTPFSTKFHIFSKKEGWQYSRLMIPMTLKAFLSPKVYRLGSPMTVSTNPVSSWSPYNT
ncbi:MAG: Release factor glutamine methyltransferase [Candidatus Collierbacteria bacterium GW2011_GWF2_42_51]|nr:MAG: Release factor glutamine methyltransferase [Candidatus Collierbacteria bacterium GW2011_GWF2_42_51]